MRKIVLTFGLISGLVVSAVLLLTQPFREQLMGEIGMIVGYTSMVAAGMLTYFGMRRYRDTVAGGRITFGRAMAVGTLIVLVSSACYTATWEAIYFSGDRSFTEKYQAHVLEKERAKGATEAQLAAKRAEFARFKQMYDNPLFNAAITMLEPLPVGLLIALVSAAALTRRRRGGEVVASMA